MTTMAYVERIIECVELMVKDGVVSSAEELQVKYGLPVLKADVLRNESDESIDKIIDVLSERNPAVKVYVQTGARSRITDNNPIQMGRGNLYGNNNKTKESNMEEDCCVKLERALVEIKYLKKALEDKDREIAQKDAHITELISRIR